MNKPNFIILGSQKSGVDWIYDNLNVNSSVFLPKNKDLFFFQKTNHNINEYYKEFLGANENQIVGECSSSYFWSSDINSNFKSQSKDFNKNIPVTIREALGDGLKFIVVLRHPVIRAISAFFHHAKRGRIPKLDSLQSYINKYGILDLGIYCRHIKEWDKVFEKDRFLYLGYEADLINNPKSTYDKICKFLGANCALSKLLPLKNDRFIFSEHGVSVSSLPGFNVSIADLKFLNDTYKKELDHYFLKNRVPNVIEQWEVITASIDEFISQNLLNEGNNFLTNEASLSSFKNLGISLSRNAINNLKPSTSLEPPVRLGEAVLNHRCYLGAFSYTSAGSFYNVDIGRYCSIARDVNIGQADHPMTTFSTSPIFYQKSFNYNTSYDYKNHINIENRKISIPILKVAKKVADKRTYIGNDVWIGNGVKILAGVKIGDGCVIGAGAVVTKNIPDYAIVGGVPAKILSYRFDQNTIKKLSKVEWWKYSAWSLLHYSSDDINVFCDLLEKAIESYKLLPYISKPVMISN